jgi:hypothetical protein
MHEPRDVAIALRVSYGLILLLEERRIEKSIPYKITLLSKACVCKLRPVYMSG